jgi:hypothetical protein
VNARTQCCPAFISDKLYITEAENLLKWLDMQNRAITAAQCRLLAGDHNARAKEAGISKKRVSLLKNIVRSFTGFASQLEMLAADVAEKPRN